MFWSQHSDNCFHFSNSLQHFLHQTPLFTNKTIFWLTEYWITYTSLQMLFGYWLLTTLYCGVATQDFPGNRATRGKEWDSCVEWTGLQKMLSGKWTTCCYQQPSARFRNRHSCYWDCKRWIVVWRCGANVESGRYGHGCTSMTMFGIDIWVLVDNSQHASLQMSALPFEGDRVFGVSQLAVEPQKARAGDRVFGVSH